MLTKFGLEVRRLRGERGIRLLDMAERLQRTASFCSAVENGRKPLPAGYANKVADVLGCTEEERRALILAADQTTKTARVGMVSPAGQELVAAFARRVDHLPPDDLELIKKIVFKMVSSADPFGVGHRGFLVSPLSAKAIRDYAIMVRRLFADDDEDRLEVMDVLFQWDVWPPSEMEGEEGRTIPAQQKIILREDVYTKAWKGDGRARFTVAHEIGHLLLHSDVAFTRSSDSYPVYRDSEWQANTFSAALLMPPFVAARFDDEYQAAKAAGMTFTAAEVTLEKYRKEGLI
jgi:transcriptional regulator with XRE-family HTH domain